MHHFAVLAGICLAIIQVQVHSKQPIQSSLIICTVYEANFDKLEFIAGILFRIWYASEYEISN